MPPGPVTPDPLAKPAHFRAYSDCRPGLEPGAPPGALTPGSRRADPPRRTGPAPARQQPGPRPRDPPAPPWRAEPTQHTARLRQTPAGRQPSGEVAQRTAPPRAHTAYQCTREDPRARPPRSVHRSPDPHRSSTDAPASAIAANSDGPATRQAARRQARATDRRTTGTRINALHQPRAARATSPPTTALIHTSIAPRTAPEGRTETEQPRAHAPRSTHPGGLKGMGLRSPSR